VTRVTFTIEACVVAGVAMRGHRCRAGVNGAGIEVTPGRAIGDRVPRRAPPDQTSNEEAAALDLVEEIAQGQHVDALCGAKALASQVLLASHVGTPMLPPLSLHGG
jgi:hypothetical protein